MNPHNEYITQTTKDTKIPPNVGETRIKHCSFFQDCPAESTVQHLATDSKDTVS